MKKIIYLIALLGVVFGCSEQDSDGHYETQDRLYFVFPTYKTVLETYTADSVIFSFGMLPDDIHQDTAKIAVRLMGRISDQVRKYQISIVDTGIYVKGKTTMEEGLHYPTFSKEQAFAPGVYEDTLKIVVYRDNLDESHVKKLSKTMVIRMEKSTDFGIGTVEQSEIKLVVNNYLSEPVWWADFSTYLKYYHPVKWKKLMEYDEAFKKTDKLDLTIPDVQQYAGWLTTYLNQNVIIDEETGKRVLMDELATVKP